MEPWEKNCIQSNRPRLEEDTICDSTVLSYLFSRKLISKGEKGRVEKAGRNDGEIAQAALFYDIIVGKEGAFPVLIEALDAARQTGASKILKVGQKNKHLYMEKEKKEEEEEEQQNYIKKENLTDGEKDSPAPKRIRLDPEIAKEKEAKSNEAGQHSVKNGQSVSSSSVIPIKVSKDNTQTMQVASSSTEDRVTSDFDVVPPAPLLNAADDFRYKVKALEDVFVTKPTSPMKFPNDSYNLSPRFKGHALFLNIEEYTGHPHLNRKGAEKDTPNMKKLWTGLGYNVIIKGPIINFDDLEGILNDFKAQFNSFTGSLVVIVASHGVFYGEYGCSVLSSDNRTINLYKDIIYKFSTANFIEEMTWRPKMFFVQACQQFPQRGSNDDIFPASNMEQTIVCFSTSPGLVSKRFEHSGSWYFRCLTEVFMENAHKKSLLELLRQTHDKVTDGKVWDEADQQKPTFREFGLKPEGLYFNLSPAEDP